MKVLIVDDHPLFSESLRPLLERSGMDVLGIAGNGADALVAIRRARPEVVLVDLDLPDMPGLDLGREILEEQPETKLLAVTAMDHERMGRRVLQAGFHGFLSKDTPLPKLIWSVKAVREGQVINLPRRDTARTSGDEEHRDAALLAGQLTPRELEVLEIIVRRGRSNALIARELGLSPNTVRTHAQSILTKLQVGSRVEAAAFAVRFGIVRSGVPEYV